MAQPEIAFDLTPLQNAHRHRGIGTYVRGLARRLYEQAEVPIEFWGWEGGEDLEVPAPHDALLLRRPPMPAYRAAWVVARLAMRRRAGRSRVRAVHITDPDALTPLRRRKLLTTVYDLIPLKHGFAERQVLARMGYRSYVRSLTDADVLFAISDQTAHDLTDLLHVPASRIKVARPGVETPAAAEAAGTDGRPYFLYLGGPNPNKNLPVLLAAMAQSRELDEELRVAGHWLPKQIAQLKARVDSGELRGRVRYVGFVPASDLVGLVREATALVIPSLDEGFGLPVAEGLAAGAVVIHSRLPVLDEISRGAALTFDPQSPEDLARCLRRAASDPDLTRRLRREGRERSTQLTWDGALETTLASYRAVLGR